MKRVDPDKRRAAFLNGICSDAGVCIAFGKETATIKKHFDHFANFHRLAIPAKRVGAVSENGFVYELTYQNAGYTAHAILKSSSSPEADNLYYEYLVGQFLNARSRRFPCFVETYGMFSYKNDRIYNRMKSVKNVPGAVLAEGIEPYDTATGITASCVSPVMTSVLIQHIHDAKTLDDKCSDRTFAFRELMYLLFQVYMPLAEMAVEFTHYDLHAGNVLVYEPVKGAYIHYHYHMKNNAVVSFRSSYIAKIIDYGRAFFHDTSNPGPDGSSRRIYDAVCKTADCEPDCGKTRGYGWLEPITNKTARKSYYISSQTHNVSHDLRLLTIIKTLPYMEIYNPNVFALCSTVKYNIPYGTQEDTKSGLPMQIRNVRDACMALQTHIESPMSIAENDTHYVGKTRLGDMHVYSDGRPLRFVANV